MSLADVVNLESDDDNDIADLVVGPNGTAIPVGQVSMLSFLC
jgi:hypothetical protein